MLYPLVKMLPQPCIGNRTFDVNPFIDPEFNEAFLGYGHSVLRTKSIR